MEKSNLRQKKVKEIKKKINHFLYNNNVVKLRFKQTTNMHTYNKLEIFIAIFVFRKIN